MRVGREEVLFIRLWENRKDSQEGRVGVGDKSNERKPSRGPRLVGTVHDHRFRGSAGERRRTDDRRSRRTKVSRHHS